MRLDVSPKMVRAREGAVAMGTDVLPQFVMQGADVTPTTAGVRECQAAQ